MWSVIRIIGEYILRNSKEARKRRIIESSSKDNSLRVSRAENRKEERAENLLTL